MTADPFVLAGFAIFRLAERRGFRRFPWWMYAGAVTVAIVSFAVGAEGLEGGIRGMLLSAVVLSAAWVLGVRTREVRREAAARSRTEERLRLVRDVHDVLSHSLGSMGVQAGVAAHVTTLGEGELRGVLREIEAQARSSLAELKLLLHDQRAEANAPASLPLRAALDCGCRRGRAETGCRNGRPKMRTIRVLIADDEPVIRSLLGLLVNSEADMAVVAEAGNGEEAVLLAKDFRPDAVLMDVQMPQMSGLEATRLLGERHRGTRVIVLTTFDLDEYVYQALRAGASGFLLKNSAPGDVLGAIRVVHQGNALLTPEVTKRLISRFVPTSASVSADSRLRQA